MNCKRLVICCAIAALVGVAGTSLVSWQMGWFGLGVEERLDPYDDPSNCQFNEELEDEAVKSDDLAADIALMWETTKREDGDAVSTARAINAASRVFNTVKLVGKNGAEVQALLGSPTKSNDSVYRGGQFWPLKDRGMVYRFDNGFYGWQVNVYCRGDNDPVTEVEKLWIH